MSPRLCDGRARTSGAIAAAVALAVLAPPEGDRTLGNRAAARADAAPAGSPITAFKQRHGVVVVSASAEALFKGFRRIGYRLEDLRKGAGTVPRVFLKAMPRDIRRLDSIPARKAVFIKTLLPLVLRVNEELRVARARIATLAEKAKTGLALTKEESSWLAAQYAGYGVARGDSAALLARVDVIPPSLALAQGAEESGWGTSRFATEGRALFGQRTFHKAPGLVPQGRPGGARFKVKRFDQLLDAVRSYAHNLNTHPAYRAFRQLRARQRADERGPAAVDPLRLAETLERYSARGPDYVETIKTIIRGNDLRSLDDARLNQGLEDALALNAAA